MSDRTRACGNRSPDGVKPNRGIEESRIPLTLHPGYGAILEFEFCVIPLTITGLYSVPDPDGPLGNS